MAALTMGNGGSAPKISMVHLVAVYDPFDGRVVHTHRVVILEGGKSISLEQAEREAVEHASRRGRDVSKLKTLVAESQHHDHRGTFRVDVAGQKLVTIEPPQRRRPK
jgi:hypothetical protein